MKLAPLGQLLFLATLVAAAKSSDPNSTSHSPAQQEASPNMVLKKIQSKTTAADIMGAAPTTHARHYAMTLLDRKSADPWVTFFNGTFYLTFTQGNHISIHESKTLTGLKDAKITRLWNAPPKTSYSAGVWAPEIHQVDGRWYIYFTATHWLQKIRPMMRRIFVLGGPPAHKSPTDGDWEFLGPMRGMPENWAIDATTFVLNGQRYMAYSGKFLENDYTPQQIHLVRMLNATVVDDSVEPVVISEPEYAWEKHGHVNEGPEYIESPDGNWKGLLYSASGAQSDKYCEGTLRFIGIDPLNPKHWQKAPKPIMKRKQEDSPPYGTGHGSFVDLDGQLIHVFHAMPHTNSGMGGRFATMQRAWWTDDGPSFGGHVGYLTDDKKKFAGDSYGHPRWDHLI